MLHRVSDASKGESATRVSFARPSLQRLSLSSDSRNTAPTRTTLFNSRVKNLNDNGSTPSRTRSSLIAKALIDAKRKNQVKPFRMTFLRYPTLVFKNSLYVSLRFKRAAARLLRLQGSGTVQCHDLCPKSNPGSIFRLLLLGYACASSNLSRPRYVSSLGLPCYLQLTSNVPAGERVLQKDQAQSPQQT